MLKLVMNLHDKPAGRPKSIVEDQPRSPLLQQLAVLLDRSDSVRLDRARLAKGGAQFWLRDIVERNRDFLREVFLNGMLVREGISDRKRMETILSADVAKTTGYIPDVIEKLYIEAWPRKISDLSANVVVPANGAGQ